MARTLWAKELDFKRGAKLLRIGDDEASIDGVDYSEAVIDGMLTVLLSQELSQLWERLDCEERESALAILLDGFAEEVSSAARKERVAGAQVTGVGVAEADFQVGTLRSVLRVLGRLEASGDSFSIFGLTDCESVTKEEREDSKAGMDMAGRQVAETWVEGLGLKRRPRWDRDYLFKVKFGFLSVTFSGDMARNWARLDCDTRRSGIEDLFRAWDRGFAEMRGRGIARWEFAGVGLAVGSTRRDEPRWLVTVRVSGDSQTVTGLRDCE